MKYLMAALLGLISGMMIGGMFGEPALATSTAVIVTSVYFCEATIIDRIKSLHGKAQKTE